MPFNRISHGLRTLAERDRRILRRYDWHRFARPEQLWPKGRNWDTWLILAGRGWGKTRTGAENIRILVEAGRARRIALIGRTTADVRDIMIEGPSGILDVFPAATRPNYEPSKRRITFSTGAVAIAYSGDNPKQLRGPEHDLAWCDELAAWRHPGEAWESLVFGLRIGARPRAIVTTTPRPIPLIRDLLNADGQTTHLTTGSTHDNRANLRWSQRVDATL